jgi:hypothetical protein
LQDWRFLNWIITGDETWCILYNTQQKQQMAFTAKKEETATGHVKRQGNA